MDPSLNPLHFWHCIFIMLVAISQAHAEPSNQPVPLLNLAQAQDEDEDEEAEETPPETPPDMLLTQSKFNLNPLRTTSSAQKPALELQLTSAVVSDSALADGETDAQSISNTLFYNGATLRVTQLLGSGRRLAADIGGSLARFDGEAGFNLLNANLGVLQTLSENMVGELGWSYRQVFGLGSFVDLEDHGPRFSLRRFDRLPGRLSLNSSYELLAYFSGPSDRSRVSNSIRLGLGYDFTEKLHGSLNYRLMHNEFTREDLDDTRHEAEVQARYQLWRNVYLGASVSYLFGDAVSLLSKNSEDFNSTRDLDNLSLGITLSVNIPLLR